MHSMVKIKLYLSYIFSGYMDSPNNFELLDCTLRDGGYYTNWDFEKDLLETYRSNIEKLPFDYIEIGYRNIPQKEYRGSFFYSPVGILTKKASTLLFLRKT